MAVPEDRRKNGMVAPFPIKDNLVLQTYYIGPFSIGILANEKAKEENTIDDVEQAVPNHKGKVSTACHQHQDLDVRLAPQFDMWNTASIFDSTRHIGDDEHHRAEAHRR